MTITIAGIDLTVEYEYHADYKGSFISPPEPAYADVLSVCLAGSDIDLTEMLSATVLCDIEQACITDAQRRVAEHQADDSEEGPCPT